MISKYKKSFESLLAIIAFPFLSWNPSVLTLLSLVAALLFFIGIYQHIYWLSIVGVFGFIFDAIDGYVARKSNKTSHYGAFLDSSLDRVSDFLIIASFGFGHLVSFELVVLVLFTSLFISYLRARSEAVFGERAKHAIGIMQRTERIVILLVGFILFLIFQNINTLLIMFLIILLLNCVTIVQRFFLFKK